MFDAKLPCFFCLPNLKLFTDFAPLAEHVKREHSESTDVFKAQKEICIYPSEFCICDKCITKKTEERKHMNLPEPSVSDNSQNPFLKVEHLPKGGTVTLLGKGNESSSQFGEGVDLEVSIGKKRYTWTVKFSSGNYTRLHKRFGKVISKWRGPVKVTVKEYAGNQYLAVV
jgi:hypothetical protein